MCQIGIAPSWEKAMCLNSHMQGRAPGSLLPDSSTQHVPSSLGKGTVPPVVCALRKFTRFGRMEGLGGFYSPNEFEFKWIIVKCHWCWRKECEKHTKVHAQQPAFIECSFPYIDLKVRVVNPHCPNQLPPGQPPMAARVPSRQSLLSTVHTARVTSSRYLYI